MKYILWEQIQDVFSLLRDMNPEPAPSLLSNDHFIRYGPCETMSLAIEWAKNRRPGMQSAASAGKRRLGHVKN
jgi:hypothetical protein